MLKKSATINRVGYNESARQRRKGKHIMAQQFSMEWAKGVIDDGVQKAQTFIDDPEQINGLLNQLQEKLKELPDTVSTAFNNVPVMAQMVKCYITREYTDVSPKVIISLVSTFIYLVKKKDIIPDDIPIVGYADDLAVATVAMAINEPELKAFAAWREQQSDAPIDLVPVEPIEIAEAEPVETDVEPQIVSEEEAEIEEASEEESYDPYQ